MRLPDGSLFCEIYTGGRGDGHKGNVIAAVRSDDDNDEHFTALMFAAAEGQKEVVSTLLKHGADKSLLDEDGESAYDFAVANGHAAVAALLK